MYMGLARVRSLVCEIHERDGNLVAKCPGLGNSWNNERERGSWMALLPEEVDEVCAEISAHRYSKPSRAPLGWYPPQ